MPNTTRAPFDSGKEFVVRKNLKCQGKRYSVGQPFPWQQFAISLRRLRQLYEAGWISYPVSDTPPPVEPKPEPKPKSKLKPVPPPKEEEVKTEEVKLPPHKRKEESEE